MRCAPELLMHTQEIDLRHMASSGVDADLCRTRSDQPHELAGFAVAHAQVPVPQEARGSESPLQECDGIVKPTV